MFWPSQVKSCHSSLSLDLGLSGARYPFPIAESTGEKFVAQHRIPNRRAPSAEVERPRVDSHCITSRRPQQRDLHKHMQRALLGDE